MFAYVKIYVLLPQVVSDCCQAAGAHRQRDKELLELHHQEAAQDELHGFISSDHGMRVTA
jgi:hypothetical protein